MRKGGSTPLKRSEEKKEKVGDKLVGRYTRRTGWTEEKKEIDTIKRRTGFTPRPTHAKVCFQAVPDHQTAQHREKTRPASHGVRGILGASSAHDAPRKGAKGSPATSTNTKTNYSEGTRKLPRENFHEQDSRVVGRGPQVVRVEVVQQLAPRPVRGDTQSAVVASRRRRRRRLLDGARPLGIRFAVTPATPWGGGGGGTDGGLDGDDVLPVVDAIEVPVAETRTENRNSRCKKLTRMRSKLVIFHVGKKDGGLPTTSSLIKLR